MQVRIFRPAKTATQQGLANTKAWRLEFEPVSARSVEPLMGWTSSRDTRRQVLLSFDTKDEAIAYAVKHGYMYTLEEPQVPQVRPKAYADNFRFDRRRPWTH